MRNYVFPQIVAFASFALVVFIGGSVLSWLLTLVPAFLQGLGSLILIVPALILAGYVVSTQMKLSDTAEKIFGAGTSGLICMLAVSYFAVTHAETNWFYVILGMIGAVFSLVGGYIGTRKSNAH